MAYTLFVTDQQNHKNTFNQDFANRLKALDELVRLFNRDIIEKHLDELLRFQKVKFDIESYGTVEVQMFRRIEMEK